MGEWEAVLDLAAWENDNVSIFWLIALILSARDGVFKLVRMLNNELNSLYVI